MRGTSDWDGANEVIDHVNSTDTNGQKSIEGKKCGSGEEGCWTCWWCLHHCWKSKALVKFEMFWCERSVKIK